MTQDPFEQFAHLSKIISSTKKEWDAKGEDDRDAFTELEGGLRDMVETVKTGLTERDLALQKTLKNMATMDSQTSLFKSRMKMEKDSLVKLLMQREEEIKELKEEIERFRAALEEAEQNEQQLDQRTKQLSEQVSTLDRRIREQQDEHNVY
ncbi:MAG: hypothetical protein EZS28_045526 [Streblomastix strix]|uniref:Uncharacterized protein n=1 Tax=Streblomastix strix TaxID=222440 RepID=A0A5J4TKX3_9EUKA|nr:MAG: hypothetical protein EZS28_045526 [Streblomastix strix]